MTRRARWTLGSFAALLVAAAGYLVYGRGAQFSPEAREVAALRQKRDQLQERFEQLSQKSPDKALASAPEEGLVIGVPTEVAEDVARQILAGYLGRAGLTLRGLHAKKSGEVDAHVLFGTHTVGGYDLDARIEVVHAALRPRELQMSFERGRFGFTLPVAVPEGRGRVKLHFLWTSKGLADIVCGDVDETRDLDGRILPAVYRLSGAIQAVAEKGSLLLRPSVDESSLRVRVEATEQAWQALDELIARQGGLCRKAIENADVKPKLAEVLAKGFDVPLPRRLLHDIALPVSVSESVPLNDVAFTLQVKPARVLVAPPWLWYGTKVSIERAGSS